MGCEGKEIDYKDLRTPEQIEMMQRLADVINQRFSEWSLGATPFTQMGPGGQRVPGQLSAPFDPGQAMAMNTMMQARGMQRPYQPFNYPQFAGWQPPMYPGGPGASGGGGGGGGNIPGVIPYDPYNPWQPKPEPLPYRPPEEEKEEEKPPAE